MHAIIGELDAMRGEDVEHLAQNLDPAGDRVRARAFKSRDRARIEIAGLTRDLSLGQAAQGSARGNLIAGRHPHLRRRYPSPGAFRVLFQHNICNKYIFLPQGKVFV
jgi:hypothetical protein